MITAILYHPTGDQDPVVQYKFGEMSRDFLQSIKCTNHVFKRYPGVGHSSSVEVGPTNDSLTGVIRY